MVEGKQQKQEHGRKSQVSGATSIVRIAGRDVDGSLDVPRALAKIKGIGHNMSRAIAIIAESKLGIPQSTAVGTLSEEQVTKLEGIISDPVTNGIPNYMINRNKDTESGKNIHVVSNDLVFNVRQDISRDLSGGLWRGFRHQYGQKVRGQHTRSTGRTGATVGVTKKAVAAATAAVKAGPAKTETKTPEKKKP
jgi:small subunit ribosomal protein S13